MKKCCFFLIVVLITCINMASADTSNNIVFHNIPWDISISELATELENRGITVGRNDISNDASMPVWTYSFRNSFMNNITSTGHKIALYYYGDDEQVSIAGYPVQELQLYAHYDISDGILKQEADDSRYYMTQIWFDVNDEKTIAIYNDLVNKLTTLYGDGTEDTTFIVETTYTFTVWKGSNDTAVCLYRSESNSSDYQFVHLMYGKTSIEEVLRNVRKLVVEEEVKSVADDITGL